MLPSDADKSTPGDEPAGDAWVSDEKGDLLPVPSHSPDGTETAPTGPAGLTAGPDAVQLLWALRRRWFAALCAGVVGAAAAAAALWHVLPIKHTVRTLLYVHATPPTFIFPTNEPRADFATYQRRQAALVKSQLVLNTALNDSKVAELNSIREQLDPVEWLQNQIKVDYSGGPEFMGISITSNRPEEAAILVNAVAKAYLAEYGDQDRKNRSDRLKNVEDLVRNYQATLDTRRRTLRKLAETVGAEHADHVAKKQANLEDYIAATRGELRRHQSDMRKARVELAVQQAKEKALASQPVDEAALEGMIKTDPILARESVHKEELEAALSADLARLKPGVDPNGIASIQKLRRDLQTVESALQARRQQLRPQAEQHLRDKAKAEVQAALAVLQERDVMYRELEKHLEKDIELLVSQTQSLNQGSMDLGDYHREIAQLEETTKKLKAEQEALTLELRAAPRVTPFEEATTPKAFDRRRQQMAALGAGGATFLGVLVLVAWLEFRTRRVNSVEQVEQGLGMRLMGTLPVLPQAGRPRLTQLLTRQEFDWRSVLTESVDAARTMLLHAARSQGVQVVMVTSAVGGEGKTSLSSQLAASLARAGRRVALVDCDLRKPSAHRLFQLERGPGLSEVLRGEAELTTVLRQTRAGGLFVLTAGQGDALAIQALAQDRLGEVFESLRPDFDFIILDSCPVLPVADSLLVAQHADGVVFSVLQGVSRLPTVYAAYQRLAVLGVRTLGAVVSGIPETSYGDRYRYATPTAE